MLRAAYEFTTPVFSGFVRPAGHLHGLVLTHDAQSRPIAAPGKCFLNLEHYTAAGRRGLFVPRDLCRHTHVSGEDWIEIGFSRTDAWPVSARLRYVFRSPDTIDAEYRFHFYQGLPDFEAFIASYMPVGTPPPLIKMAGYWTRPEIRETPREQLFIARDEPAKSLPNDGRWQELFERGFAYRVHDGTYDIPVMVTTFEGGFSRPALIQMAESRQCPAISPNVFAPAHDFCLIGYDVQADQEIAARARLIYRQIGRPSEAEALYQDFHSQ